MAAYGVYREATQCFLAADRDGNGVLDRSELIACSQGSGVLAFSDEAEARSFFAQADVNHDGVLDREEFLLAYAQRATTLACNCFEVIAAITAP